MDHKSPKERVATRNLLLRSFLIIAAITLPARVFACSCIGIPVEVEQRNSALVFIGRGVVLQPYSDPRLHGIESITWEVLQSWNRKAPRVVKTYSGGGCGYSATRGGLYVVFAHQYAKGGPLNVSMCSNNVRFECAESVLQRLGRIRTSFEPIPAYASIAKQVLPCNCLEGVEPVSVEHRRSAAVFIGRAVDVQPTDSGDAARVTWAVIEAWTRDTPRRLSVLVATDGDTGCGGSNFLAFGYYPQTLRTVVGRVALIFARRLRTGELFVPSCSNSMPLVCMQGIPSNLGRPAIIYEPVPGLGTNNSPLDCSLRCVNIAGPISGLRGCLNDTLPRGTFLKDVSFTVWTDGTVHDVQFALGCQERVAEAWKSELAMKVRAVIESSVFSPAVIRDRAVAVQIREPIFHRYPP